MIILSASPLRKILKISLFFFSKSDRGAEITFYKKSDGSKKREFPFFNFSTNEIDKNKNLSVSPREKGRQKKFINNFINKCNLKKLQQKKKRYERQSVYTV